jgi:hypothetical protein
VGSGVDDHHETFVLEEHHRTNRTTRPPDPARLNRLRSHMSLTTAVPRRRAPRHSVTPYGSKPPVSTQLRWYPPQWSDVLNDGKDIFTLYLVTKVPFPGKRESLDEVEECLHEAIRRHEEKGRGVEPGES